MFLTLLLVTFLVSVLACFIVVRIFDKPIQGILNRIVADDISNAWLKYVKFAIFVVGISGGVRIWALERYVNPNSPDEKVLVLNWERWTLDIYSTIIQTLQSIAWMLLVFFTVALIAYVLVRIFELRHSRPKSPERE
jgi:peptidoglycan/LPS O-acetylase OafA/YrhL